MFWSLYFCRWNLKNYILIAQGIEKLFFPQVEIVLHDIKKSKIIYIQNAFSGRKIGDPSYLDELKLDKSNEIIGPYQKFSTNGKKLKSISIILEEKYLLCINFDIYLFDQIKLLLNNFLTSQNIEPLKPDLFKDDWLEKINIYIFNYLSSKNISIDEISKKDKKEIILNLKNIGAFKEKNAASHLSKILKISRATIYNYLNVKE